MTIGVSLAKRAMRLVEKFPAKDNLAMAQIFDQEAFTQASAAQKREIMRVSSRYRMDHEHAKPFEWHFRRPIRPYLEGKTVLDLGSFTGGRTAAWHKKYNVKKSYGVDVDQVFIDASRQCAEEEGVDAEFALGFGETLPFPDNKFDAIVSFDVFEHVRDVGKTMAECLRVLKPGGVLIVVFPPFYCPSEHHLSCVSWTPFLHWFFNKDTLFQAYREIIKERPDAEWYLPSNEKLRDWEALYTLNGVTVSSFNDIVKKQGWMPVDIYLPFWLANTRHVSNFKWRRRLWRLLGVVNKIPGIQELATDRICAILKKP